MRSVLLSAVAGLTALGLSAARADAPPSDAAPAKIHVTLPADAQLTFDGARTTATSADRMFVTPPLQEGKVYHYTLQAHYMRGDDAVTVARRITVRAGQETDVAFGEAGASADNRAYYYDPAAPGQGQALSSAPAAPSYYYGPSYFNAAPPYYFAPNLNVPHGGVAPARDNWKPDFSDPFLYGDNW